MQLEHMRNVTNYTNCTAGANLPTPLCPCCPSRIRLHVLVHEMHFEGVLGLASADGGQTQAVHLQARDHSNFRPFKTQPLALTA